MNDWLHNADLAYYTAGFEIYLMKMTYNILKLLNDSLM